MIIRANVKEVNVKTLVSGDKQGRIVLDVVGEEELNNLKDLLAVPVEEQVIIKTNE